MKLMDKKCEVCGAGFLVKPSALKRGRGRCCSLSCSASLAAVNRRSQNGEENPNWRGGLSIDRPVYLARKSEYRSLDPLKAEAHRLTRNAIRSKKLVPMPCEICGHEKVDAHHDDYSKPLLVRWLCRAHHMRLHANK